MLLTSDQKLLNKAIDSNVQIYVRSGSFNRQSWYPRGLRLIRGRKGTVDANHALANKSIADVYDAPIGAAHRSFSDATNFDMAIWAVSLFRGDDSCSPGYLRRNISARLRGVGVRECTVWGKSQGHSLGR